MYQSPITTDLPARLRRLLLALGVMVCLGSALAAQHVTAAKAAKDSEPPAREDLSRIEAAAIAHARQLHTASGVQLRVLPLDSRLQLSRCAEPLATSGGMANSARIAVRVSCPGPQPWRLYVRVELQRVGSVVVAARPLSAGSMLRAGDLRIEERDLSRLRGAYAQSPGELTGRQLRRGLRSGEVVPLAGLAREVMVRNGDPVSIVSGGAGYRISMRGTALRDGFLGARVSVRNASSGRIVEGRVIDQGTVQVGPGADLVADTR